MSTEPTASPEPEDGPKPPRRKPPQRRRPPKRTVRGDEEERNVLLDEEHTPPVSTLTGREPAEPDEAAPAADAGSASEAERPAAQVQPADARGQVAPGKPRDIVASLVSRLPDAHPRQSEGDALFPSERQEYDLCNKVFDLADSMWWAVGKAAEIVREGDQYIEEFGTWEDFCKIRMEKTARSIDMTISLWQLGAHLNSTVGELRDLTVKEDWARKLKPYADAHGHNAAAFVLDQLAEALAAGRLAKITGPIIETALSRLPEDNFDEALVADVLREFPGGTIIAKVPEPREPDPGEAVSRQVAKIGGAARSIMKFAKNDPGTAARVADELQELVDELRKIQ